MPVDTSIYGGGGAGGGSRGSSPFGMLGDIMALSQWGQDMRDRRQMAKWRQQQIDIREEQIADEDAIRGVIQKYALPDSSEVSWDDAINELDESGRGRAGLLLRSKVFEIRKNQALEIGEKLKSETAMFGFASNMLKSVKDDIGYQRVVPMLRKMVPQAAQFLPAEYDKDTIDQLITSGQTHSEHLAAQKEIFDRANTIMTNAHNWAKDEREWTAKLPTLEHELTNLGSGYLSLARNQQEWDASMTRFSAALTGLPSDTKASIIGKFGNWGPGATERARMLGMSQAERSQERDRTLRRAMENQADNVVASLTPKGIDMMADAVAQGGEIPAFGSGNAGTKARIQVINAAAEKYAGLDMVSQRAAAKAITAAIVDRTKQLSNISTYKAATMSNLDNFITAAERVHNNWKSSKSPWLNTRIQDIGRNLLGDQDLAVLEAARTFALPEVTRIINNPNLVGASTVSARKELNDAIPRGMNLGQAIQVVKLAKQDMLNRETSLQQEITDQQRILAMTPNSALGYRQIIQPTAPTTQTPGVAVGSIITQNGVQYRVTAVDAQGRVTAAEPVVRR